MNRAAFIALAGLALALLAPLPSRGGLGQLQRAQQTVYVLVNVTNPLGKANTPQHNPVIATRMTMRAKGSQPSVASDVRALGSLVAQTSSQKSVRVQAEVTPNPNATLLVTNTTNISLGPQAAGSTHVYSCAFTVTSNAASISSWTLRQGLSGDLISGTWPGQDIANNVYISTPLPTSTPYIVYPSAWTNAATNGATKTYCVDLTVTVPSAVLTGGYSTTAVYTLWY